MLTFTPYDEIRKLVCGLLVIFVSMKNRRKKLNFQANIHYEHFVHFFFFFFLFFSFMYQFSPCPESSALPPVTTLTTTLKPSSAAYISENTTHLLPPVAAVQNNPPNSGTFKGKLFSTLRKVFTSVFASSNDSSANTNHAADSTKSSTGTAKGSLGFYFEIQVFLKHITIACHFFQRKFSNETCL